MTKSKSSTKENVVILGGGLGGTIIAKELSAKLDHSKYNLILVEARPYLIWILGGTRMTVTNEKGAPDDYLFDYEKFFPAGKGTVKKAKAEKIVQNSDGRGGKLELAGGEILPYRALVLATGSKWTGPIDFPEDDADIRQFVSQWQQRFKSAEDVVIVGGGAVGIELAGELRDEYPNKKITIVQGSDKLLNSTYPDRFRKFVQSQMRARGIDLILGEYVDQFPPSGSGELVFRSGRKINAGVVAVTSGPVPNTGMIAESLGEDTLTERKHVKVLPTLQLKSHPSIFALGDIIDWNEQKQLFKIGGHASVIMANILSLLSGSKPQKQYKTGPEVIVVTNGRGGGGMYLGMLWGIVFGNWAARMLKSKDLGLSMIRPRMNAA
ncbi:FAD/NAD(P)-binding domain-containing protein [Thelephora ganbajun]|uniref:FAD/NAD(P)-binding domain-containing protein n=1 Tax=Thelephora ganbajun TaxID=370292 RepID=A0ACB6ZDN9_THEGA|nr:FAD/NAD(P)-binding domain-containing protein [Thelephora ganbajun]